MSFLASTIRSIQYGTFSFSSGGADTVTATLSPGVDPSKTTLSWLGNETPSTVAGPTRITGLARFTLTNSTTVTAVRDSTVNGMLIVGSFCAEEHK